MTLGCSSNARPWFRSLAQQKKPENKNKTNNGAMKTHMRVIFLHLLYFLVPMPYFCPHPLFLSFFFSSLWHYWGLNSRLHAYYTGGLLPFEPLHQLLRSVFKEK
jgi:4-amino-4-deoxy-L-arabinose transferase-like glycosyltransferase